MSFPLNNTTKLSNRKTLECWIEGLQGGTELDGSSRMSTLNPNLVVQTDVMQASPKKPFADEQAQQILNVPLGARRNCDTNLTNL
jgi:hypothetical protein